jgi:spermidine synthase
MFNDFVPIDPHQVKPFVYEDERTVSLHFDISATQSSMRRGDPSRLELAYTRTMMGFLLVEPAPASLLMIGLGGGSLPKYCHRHLPCADVTVVEVNPHVIAMRDAFLVPPDGERLRVIQADGAAFVAHTRERYDVVMVDGFTYDGQPPELCSPPFYAHCRGLLREPGLLVVNLHDEEPACHDYFERIARAFDGDALQVPAEAGNRIVFAGRSAEFDKLGTDFEARWAALPEVHRRTLRGSVPRIARAARLPAPA